MNPSKSFSNTFRINCGFGSCFPIKSFDFRLVDGFMLIFFHKICKIQKYISNLLLSVSFYFRNDDDPLKNEVEVKPTKIQTFLLIVEGLKNIFNIFFECLYTIVLNYLVETVYQLVNFFRHNHGILI